MFRKITVGLAAGMLGIGLILAVASPAAASDDMTVELWGECDLTTNELVVWGQVTNTGETPFFLIDAQRWGSDASGTWGAFLDEPTHFPPGIYKRLAYVLPGSYVGVLGFSAVADPGHVAPFERSIEITIGEPLCPTPPTTTTSTSAPPPTTVPPSSTTSTTVSPPNTTTTTHPVTTTSAVPTTTTVLPPSTTSTPPSTTSSVPPTTSTTEPPVCDEDSPSWNAETENCELPFTGFSIFMFEMLSAFLFVAAVGAFGWVYWREDR